MAGAAGRKKFTNAMIEAALRKHHGLIPRAADELETSRQTVQQRVDRSPALQAVLVDIADSLKGNARCAIAEAIAAKDMPTVRWYADRHMRDEGYGTRVEIGLDTGKIEKIADAIAKGGVAGLRAVKAALAGTG